MHKKIIRLFIIAFVVASSFVPHFSNVTASSVEIPVESVQRDCTGLDVVFLVSFSEPMNINDSIHLRKRAIQTAIETIADNAIYLCPGYQHRLAVVAYGDLENPYSTDTVDLIDPISINPSLNDLELWTAKKYELFAEIPATLYLGRYSNVEAALTRAAEILRVWRGAPPDILPRKQAVIMISDGDLCTHEYGCSFQTAIDRLNPLVDPNSSYIPANVYLAHIGVYTDDMYVFWENKTIAPFWAQVTANHNGANPILFQNAVTVDEKKAANQEIDAEISSVLGTMLGSDLGEAVCSNGVIDPIWVEPYENNFLILYIYRYRGFEGTDPSEVSVSIHVSTGSETLADIKDGTQLEGQSIDFIRTTDGLNERYVFFQPPPGKYSFQVEKADPCQDISILSGSKGITVEFLGPSYAAFQEYDAEPFYDQQNPIKFRFQVLQISQTGESQPVREMADYPLNMRLQMTNISLPDTAQNTSFYDLVLVDQNEAIYETIQPLSLQHPGDYEWRFTASTKDPRSLDDPTAPEVVVATINGDFEITPLVRTFGVRWIGSFEDEVFITDKIAEDPLDARIQIYDVSTGKDLREDLRISSVGEDPFVARLLIKENGTWVPIDEEPMTFIPGNSYTASLIDPVSNQFTESEYQLRIELTNEYASTSYIPESRDPIVLDFRVTKITEQAFSWQVERPRSGSSNSTRANFNWFAEPDLSGLMTITAQTTDGEKINSQDMLKLNTTTLFTATLVDLASRQEYALEYVADPATGSFTAIWPKDAPVKGEFRLENIQIVSDNLFPGWTTITEAPEGIEFSLRDKPWAMPWSLLALLILIVIAVLTVVLFILNSGSLHKCTLDFTSDAEAPKRLLGSIKIYRFLCTRKIIVSKKEIQKEPLLAEIIKIKAEKVRPTVENARVAVDTDITFGSTDYSDVQPESGFSERTGGIPQEQDATYVVSLKNLNEGEGDKAMIQPGNWVTLQRGKTGFLEKAKFPLLIGLTLLLIWLGIFGFLSL